MTDDLDPPMWSFDVFTSPHDDVKRGILERVHSRVTISRTDYPSWVTAYAVAAEIAVAVHGGMPTRVLVRY